MNNPNYIPYSHQERHRIIDAIIESSVEALHVPEVANRLSLYKTDLLDLLNHVAVPNLRHNIVSLAGHRTNHIPVVALHIGEKALRQHTDLTFSPSQKYAINKAYKSREAQDIFKMQQQYYLQHPTPRELQTFNAVGTAAYVDTGRLQGQRGAKALYIHGRPLVAFSADHVSSLSPVIALHEFTHAIQTNREPITETNAGDIPPELEGYFVGAQVALGYQEAGREEELRLHTPSWLSEQTLAIEAIRQHHNQSKGAAAKFQSSQKLVDDLFKADLPLTPDMYDESVHREQANS